jgi:tape measure domain-containing protein
MLNLGTIFCLLGCDTSGLNAGEARMAKFVAGANRQFAAVEKTAGQLKGAIGAIVSTEMLRRGVMLADSYKSLNARIMQSTKATKDYLAVQSRIESMSMDTGTGFGTNTQLFQSIARTAPEIGATQKEVLRLTDSLGKLSVISGASGEAMKNSMLQFGQAMAGGIVRAEEWNSIMENTPEIGNRIAQGLGMTVGQLRLMVNDGKVLSKDVFESLLKQSAQIDADFGQMPRTIGQSMSSLETGAMKFLGGLDQALGVTGGLSSMIQSLGVYLAGDFSNAFFGVSSYVARIGDSLGLWKTYLIETKNELGLSAGFVDTLATGFGGIIDMIPALPINLRYLFEQGGLYANEFFTITKLGIDTIGNGFQLVWALIKTGALATAAFVAQQFANVINAVLSGISDMAGYAADLSESMGFIDTANSIDQMAAGIKKSSNGVDKLVDGFNKAANGAADSVVAIHKAGEGLAQAAQDELGYIEEAKQANMDRFQEESNAMLDNQEAREAAHLADLKLMDLKRQRAEKNFQEQTAQAKQLTAIQNGGGGSGGGGSSKATNDFQQRLDSLTKALQTETELENNHYAESLAILNQAEANKVASILPYHELRERLEEEHMKKLRDIVRDGEEEMASIKGWNAFLGVKLQEKAGDMEIDAQAKTFKGLIDDAAEHSRVFFEMKKALALATALIDAPKAVLASFAFGSEIGGPVVGAIFGGIAAAAVGVQVASIASAQYTGAKAMGGNVFAGQKYKVNEQGPEMLSSGGEDFLLMGSKGGHITPNNKLGSGGDSGSNVVINIQNYSGASVTTKETNGVDGKTIDIILKQVDAHMADNIHNARGSTAKAIERTYNLNRGRKTA